MFQNWLPCLISIYIVPGLPVLRSAGLEPGLDYPLPVVDLREAGK
ncbi:MAG: hypothetical protein ACNYPG_00375 [Candidatus Porifericomitaceae bacterium WSBS_2022_MAG_OTU9]